MTLCLPGCFAAPLRGIPSRLPSGGFTGTSNLSRLSAAAGTPASRLARNPAGRKEGRVKMLDINEQPIGFQAQQQQNKNKRKKLPGEWRGLVEDVAVGFECR